MPLELAWSSRDGADCLRVSGPWAGQGLAVFPADVLAASTVALPPMSGCFEADDGATCFVPRFPFIDGTAYTVVAADGDRATLHRPAVDAVATTRVVELYPTATKIPFNQLKLYVHFSAPMSEGFALRHVHVLADATGEELPAAFHPMDPELWDAERRRLTVLFDPARIKRGLAAHREIGYPLQPGRSVRVRVDAEFRDARGAPLRSAFERRYQIGADVRSKVDPGAWTVTAPSAGSRQPLTVVFDRPLDHALALHCLTVTDGSGRAVAGQVVLGAEERLWQLTPFQPWDGGAHTLVVEGILEDLAGNSVVRVFDRDLDRPEDAPLDAARIVVDFAIR